MAPDLVRHPSGGTIYPENRRFAQIVNAIDRQGYAPGEDSNDEPNAAHYRESNHCRGERLVCLIAALAVETKIVRVRVWHAHHQLSVVVNVNRSFEQVYYNREL